LPSRHQKKKKEKNLTEKKKKKKERREEESEREGSETQREEKKKRKTLNGLLCRQKLDERQTPSTITKVELNNICYFFGITRVGVLLLVSRKGRIVHFERVMGLFFALVREDQVGRIAVPGSLFFFFFFLLCVFFFFWLCGDIVLMLCWCWCRFAVFFVFFRNCERVNHCW